MGFFFFFMCHTFFKICLCILVVLSFFPQPGNSDQGVPENYNPCHPDRVCSGALPSRAAGGVDRTARLSVEAAGRCKPKLCSYETIITRKPWVILGKGTVHSSFEILSCTTMLEAILEIFC